LAFEQSKANELVNWSQPRRKLVEEDLPYSFRRYNDEVFSSI